MYQISQTFKKSFFDFFFEKKLSSASSYNPIFLFFIFKNHHTFFNDINIRMMLKVFLTMCERRLLDMLRLNGQNFQNLHLTKQIAD